MNKKTAAPMCAGAESLALARAIAGAECPLELVVDPEDAVERLLDQVRETAFTETTDVFTEVTPIYKDPGPRWNSNGKAKKRPWAGSSR